ncbi:MAG: SAM-dependent methyltransferase [Candidatus Hadarchaeales archaeon]
MIEHLEPRLSEWLMIEYSSAARIVGRKNLMITNVGREAERKKLAKISRVASESAASLFDNRYTIVLDPQAKKTLLAKDAEKARAIVVGGILGDDPPQGRTRELLSKKLPRAKKRNLGKSQFSIDGSVFLAKQIASGHSLEELPCVHDVEIKIAPKLSIILPFSYPLLKGKPLISRALVRYLKQKGASF